MECTRFTSSRIFLFTCTFIIKIFRPRVTCSIVASNQIPTMRTKQFSSQQKFFIRTHPISGFPNNKRPNISLLSFINVGLIFNSPLFVVCSSIVKKIKLLGKDFISFIFPKSTLPCLLSLCFIPVLLYIIIQYKKRTHRVSMRSPPFLYVDYFLRYSAFNASYPA